MPVIADLALTITPATALYKRPVLDANITVSETLTEGRHEIVLDLFQGDGIYSRDLGTIFQWPTGGAKTSIALNIPAATMPWDPNDPTQSFYNVGGTARITIPCAPGQQVTFQYQNGTIRRAGVGPAVDGNGEGLGTTGGVHPWPSDRYGGFAVSSATQFCGAFLDISGHVITVPSVSCFQINDNFTTPVAPPGTVALSVGVNSLGANFTASTGSWNYVYSYGAIGVNLPRIVLYTWQPTLIEQPETIYDRAGDWDDGGYVGDKFIQGLTIEANSFNVGKTFFLQDSDTLTLHSLNECPFTFNKQSVRSFSCVTPFIAHSCRVISTDGVAWQVFHSQLAFQPFPSSCLNWETEMTSLALTGYGHVREMNIAHVSTADLTLVLKFDSWPTITLTIANSGGLQAKTKVTLPPNKFKLIGLRIFSSAVFRLFEQDVEMKSKTWGSQGPYTALKPFGGSSNMGAKV